MIDGEATVEVDGINHKVSKGDLLFFPTKVFHDIQVITDRIKLLVIYPPPYEEVPNKVIKRSEPTANQARSSKPNPQKLKMRAPKCLGSPAIVSMVSAEALNKRS